jgi:hypothetical protein
MSDFAERAHARASVAADHLLSSYIQQASTRSVPLQNHPTKIRIKNIPPDEAGRSTLIALITESHRSGDIATLAAAMQSIARSPEGRHDLALLRTELFGGNMRTKTHPTRAYIWEKAMGDSLYDRAPDLVQAPIEAFADVTAARLVGWDVETVARYINFINGLLEHAVGETDPNEKDRWLILWSSTLNDLKTAHDTAMNLPSVRGRYTLRSRELVSDFLRIIEEPL